MSKLFYIRHTTSHHSSFSGYSKLLAHIQGEVISEEGAWLPYSLRKKLASSCDQHAGIYDSRSVQKELALSWKMLTMKNGMAHFLNAERDVRFSTYLKNRRAWNFVATFHKPPDILKTTITNLKYLKRLDGAIAVGTNQVEYLSGLIGTGAVSFIPHGIDTDFFRPVAEDWNPQSIVFVGNHMRDVEALREVVLIIQKRFPQFQLHVVASESATKLTTIGNVIFYSKISDERLLSLYQRAALLLIPLTDVTACNSILEALACGLPVVTTRLPGHEGYLTDQCAVQIETGNVHRMAEAAIGLMEDGAWNRRMREAARDQSLHFSWPVIGKQMMNFYSQHFNFLLD